MFSDVTWDYFDRLVEGYGAASAYVSALPELEVKIAQACAALLSSRAGMGDLSALLTTPSEEVQRKVAWASQHIFGRRAWCVGQKIVRRQEGGRRAWSPLVGQLRLLGHVPVETEFEAGEGLGYAAGEKIDALLASPGENEVLLVKGCSYSRAKRVSPELWVNSDKQSLFERDGRFMSNVRVRRQDLAALLLGRDVLRAAFPQLRVRAIFMVINDPECSWHFQCHDLEKGSWEMLKKSRVGLDEFPLAATFRQFREAFASESDTFAGLPAWAGENLLMAAPVDRPTRALMLLNELWTRQINKPERLVAVRGSELAAAVQERCAVAYPNDLWRHDLEDCLERGRFVRRCSDRESAFALLPKGVARLILLKQKFDSQVPPAPAMVIHHVGRQAKLWAAAPVG